jgi:hypothetical protein
MRLVLRLVSKEITKCGTALREANYMSILVLPAALGPGAHSVSNRNEYQKQGNNVSREQSAAGV